MGANSSVTPPCDHRVAETTARPQRLDPLPDWGTPSVDSLHVLLNRHRGAPDHVILRFLQSHPGAAAVEVDNDGRLPLHYALFNRAPEAVTLAVFHAYPLAVKVQGKDGSFPLHLALQCSASEAVTLAILHTHPAAAEEKNQFGKFILDSALQYLGDRRGGAPEAVTLAVLRAFPQAAQGRPEAPIDEHPLRIALDCESLHVRKDEAFDPLASDRTKVALLEHDPEYGLIVVASYYCDLGSARGLFNLVVAGGTTLGGFSAATSALKARFTTTTRTPADPDGALRMLRRWHRGGVLWKNCLVQMLTHVTPAALSIAEFLTGVCGCEKCTWAGAR